MASILKVNTIQDATNSNTAMTIDSAGRILYPARPHALVDLGGDASYPAVADTATIPFDNVVYETGGSNYDTSNYRYVAPITGLYQICFSTILDGVTTLNLYLRVNNGIIHRWYIADSRHMTWTLMYHVNASDYFDLSHDTGASRNLYQDSTPTNRYTTVSYTLIG